MNPRLAAQQAAAADERLEGNKLFRNHSARRWRLSGRTLGRLTGTINLTAAMNFSSKRQLALVLFSSLLTSCAAPDWHLPIKLGDSREHVRSILGDRRPCVPGSKSDTCDSFPNSGISVEYDGDRVHAITIGGGHAGTDGIPYESQIVHGISIRDELQGLKAKLGEPIVVEPAPPSRYKWRRPPWMIEVVIGTDRDGAQKGKILWLTITNAVG